jgi:hypothetical protein
VVESVLAAADAFGVTGPGFDGLRAALAHAEPGEGAPRLNLSGLTDEDWTMLASINARELRTALTELAKAQAEGDA